MPREEAKESVQYSVMQVVNADRYPARRPGIID